MIIKFLKNLSLRLDKSYNFFYFLYFFTVILVLIFTLTSIVNVDEGWYHSVAKAKNTFGFYTFPAFYDVPLFKGDFMLNRDLTTQFFRFADLVIRDNLLQIKFVRIMFFCIWSFVSFLFVRTKVFDLNKLEQLQLSSILVSFPLIFYLFGIARQEIIISAIIMLIIYLLYMDYNESEKYFKVLFLSTVALFFHPNGFFLILIFAIIVFRLNNIRFTFRYYFTTAVALLIYYIIIIDVNKPLYDEQFNAMFESGKEQKFITNPGLYHIYLLNEIKDRYLNVGSLNDSLFSFELLSALINIILFSLGIYFLFKEKKYYYILLYTVSIMVLFSFLGNKTPQYLIFIVPLLVTAVMCRLSKSKVFSKVKNLLVIVLLSFFWIIIIWSIRINIKEIQQVNEISGIINKNSLQFETIYAPFAFEPYINESNKYLTTNQKTKNNFFDKYNINPENCIAVFSKEDNILKYCKGDFDTLAIIFDYTIVKVK